MVLEASLPLASLGIVSATIPRPVRDPCLDEVSREVLDLERDWWKTPGPKERQVRERLGLSPARYHQILNRAIDLPEALAYDPMLVRRLRRVREERRRKRSARRLGLPI
jgi:hypothetical protein